MNDDDKQRLAASAETRVAEQIAAAARARQLQQQTRAEFTACRAIRKCQPVGTGTVRKTRRELVECLAADCGLIWAPARTHLTAVPTAS